MTPAIRAILLGRRTTINSFSAVKLMLEQDMDDVNILVMGDSTGDASNEWAYLFAAWLGATYPRFSVDYYLWTAGAYAAPVALTTGSGAHKLNFWNASVAGASPVYHMGGTFTAAVVTPSPDVLIWNHGHNLAGFAVALQRGEFVGAMDQVRIAMPDLPHVAFRQNPRRDDDQMTQVVNHLDDLAADYGDVLLVDAYSLFLARQKHTSLYTDNQHPNAAGEQLFLEAVQQKWRATRVSGVVDPVPAFLSSSVTNLLANADFSDVSYAGGTPTSWTATNTPTCVVESTIVDSGKTQSLKMTGTTAQARISQSLTGGFATALRGKKVSFAVRQYVPAGSAATVGWISLTSSGGGTVSASASRGTTGVDGWRWYVLSGLEVGASATAVTCALASDSAANADSTVYYDRAILVEGEFPRDMT
jgi:hypothetical protein